MELAPILHKQQEFLQNEFTQPLPTSTRPTTSYHRPAQIKTTPNPTFYTRLQQEATQLGITPEELAAISEQAIHKQAEWLTLEEADRRRCKGERR